MLLHDNLQPKSNTKQEITVLYIVTLNNKCKITKKLNKLQRCLYLSDMEFKLKFLKIVKNIKIFMN